MREKGGQKPPHASPESMSGIIIDHTNKFTVVENWLFERDDLGVCDKLIYIVLKSWANCERIWPSHKTIAKKASVSVATVKRTLSSLIGKRLLVVESGKGNGGCNVYHLCGPEGKKAIPKGVAHSELPTLAHHELPGSSHRATTNTSLQKQDTTTTVVVADGIKKLIFGTPFQGLDEQSLLKYIAKYGCLYVFDSLDMLIATYKQSEKEIKNPVAVLASGLLKGVIPPSDYIPYHERIGNEQIAREKAELKRISDEKKKGAEEEVYSQKVAHFDALAQQDQEGWLKRARNELSPVLRSSKSALRSMAIELCYKEL